MNVRMCSLRLLPVLHMISQFYTSIARSCHGCFTKSVLILVDEVSVCTM